VTTLLDWVSSLDLGTLYALLGLVAFIESIFPPAPADVVVAFGAFLAARQGADIEPVVFSIVCGSTLGALVIYALARRFGADKMHGQLRRLRMLNAEERLEGLYAHYGLAAIFVSRFVPGLRAVVPPMAGALRIPSLRFTAVITVASTLWYGLIIFVAFRVGAEWESVRSTLHVVVRRVGITAIALALILALVGWELWRRHRRKHPHLHHPPAE